MVVVQGICDILVPGEFINDDTLTIVCEMTLPGNDVTKLGYTYNAEVGIQNVLPLLKTVVMLCSRLPNPW